MHFVIEDPACIEYSNLYACSPLFSVNSAGATFPSIANGVTITFIIMPNVFPTLGEILSSFDGDNLWFTLGIANLVVIEEKGSSSSNKILEKLQAEHNCVAYERWIIKNGAIEKIEKAPSKDSSKNCGVEHLKIPISSKLPLHLKFSVSEYIISVEKFLTASKRFTPQYYDKHKKTISAGNDLVYDLSFLHGDESFEPTQSTLNLFRCKDITELSKLLKTKEAATKVEELINDKYSRLIQFNSSMSYVYSQAYAGTFPIFDHFGIIRRHSLLGIGSAISALFEILTQIEEALYLLPFEEIEDSEYTSTQFSDEHIFGFFSEPGNFNPEIWHSALKLKQISHEKLPDDFYYRLAFFSGRLGFREYDLSATSAIQVLVEAYSLQWNVINYTHEIIHNHVRTILNSVLNGTLSVHHEEYIEWLKGKTENLKAIHANRFESGKQSMTYTDYFIYILLNFSVNSMYFGSISKESNYDLVRKKRVATVDYSLPEPIVLKEIVISLYKDINEIFVHIIDFSYIYSRETKAYVMSIWTSWITVSSVIYDLKQYLIRTLLIIALGIKGESKHRYDEAKKHLIHYLEELKGLNFSESIFTKIVSTLEDKDDDILYRFYNCIIIADLVNTFFIGNLEVILDNEDSQCLAKGTKDEFGDIRVYDLETNSFKSNAIKSKVRFLLDQLLRAIKKGQLVESDSERERTSAWLLLSLSSYNTPS